MQCSIDECEGRHYARGWCEKHYNRWKKHGDPSICLKPQRARRSRGLELVDAFATFKPTPVGECLEWPAPLGADGYGSLRHEGRLLKAHRVAYELRFGHIPDGSEIDHVCRNRGCVNTNHLRIATHKQNNENHGGPQANNTSGVRGVHWHNSAGKWQAQIKHNGKRIHVGLFSDLVDAEAAVIAARNSFHTFNDADRLVTA
ncbi:HNH endonuclease signature motif containing protein [Rhodococcus globerulus]|uniref:HNH endonuclease signature motif containing protein n=1 Tax=Rhodococcus globerulus TaxID=33008 RepID=UPI0039E7BBBB